MADPHEARVPLIDAKSQLPADRQHHFTAIEQSRDGVRGPFRALLNSPEVAGRVGYLGAYIRYESTLSDPARELTILTTAQEYECAYEWVAHEPIAREAGVRDVAIDAVTEQRSLDDLTEIEACILSFSRELLQENDVTDATFESTRDQFGVKGVTEIVATMGYYGLLACVLNAFEVTPNRATE